MNTTNLTVGAGAIVILGRWSQGKGMDVRVVVGVVTLAVLLSILPDEIGSPLAALVLVAVMFTYLPGIIEKTGVAS